jgi:hypothetical protein
MTGFWREDWMDEWSSLTLIVSALLCEDKSSTDPMPSLLSVMFALKAIHMNYETFVHKTYDCIEM